MPSIVNTNKKNTICTLRIQVKYTLCMDGSSTERNNKDMKMKWYELARSRMKELGITQEKLAEELGMTQVGLDTGCADLVIHLLVILVWCLNTLVLITYHSTTTGHFHLLANTHRPQLKKQYEYPVFSHVQAGMFSPELRTFYQRRCGEIGKHNQKKPVTLHSGLRLKVTQ